MHPREFPFSFSPDPMRMRGNVNGVICLAAHRRKNLEAGAQVHLFKFHALVPASCGDSNYNYTKVPFVYGNLRLEINYEP